MCIYIYIRLNLKLKILKATHLSYSFDTELIIKR